MKGKIFLIIGIVLLSVIILVGAFYLFVLSGAIFMFNSNPPAPEITYGEFPIKVTCEINGEIKVIEDTVICEFDGFENLYDAPDEDGVRDVISSPKWGQYYDD